MMNASLWADFLSTIPHDTKAELEKFISFSEVKTGDGRAIETRLLETLSLSYALDRRAN